MPNKIITENESKELNPIIEKMVEADIETVMRIERKSFDSPWSKRSFMQYVREKSRLPTFPPSHVAHPLAGVKRVLVKLIAHRIIFDPDSNFRLV